MPNGNDSRIRLDLFSNRNFSGRSIIIRGRIAVLDARQFRFNGELSSFRLNRKEDEEIVTLVLWSRTHFRGARRVFRGSMNISNLGSFDNRMSSFIVIPRRLSDSEIDTLERRGLPPFGDVIIGPFRQELPSSKI